MGKSTNKIKQSKTVGRTPPMVPKAGVTLTKRRYGCGGKIKKS
jgi:hypothetical protein